MAVVGFALKHCAAGNGLAVALLLEQDAQTNTIRLEGAIGIGCAAELKEALLEAFKSGGEVRVVLDGATDLDVTAMQLLWAAERRRSESGANFKIVDGMPAPIAAAFTHAGIDLF